MFCLLLRGLCFLFPVMLSVVIASVVSYLNVTFPRLHLYWPFQHLTSNFHTNQNWCRGQISGAIFSPCSPGPCGDVLSCLICLRDSEVELVQGGERVRREVWRVDGDNALAVPPSHVCRVNNLAAACSRWSLAEYQQRTPRREKPLLGEKLSGEPRQPHNSPLSLIGDRRYKTFWGKRVGLCRGLEKVREGLLCRTKIVEDREKTHREGKSGKK